MLLLMFSLFLFTCLCLSIRLHFYIFTFGGRSDFFVPEYNDNDDLYDFFTSSEYGLYSQAENSHPMRNSIMMDLLQLI